MLLLIDNYDSFTYNLYQSFAALYPNVEVVRNDKLSVESVAAMAPKAIIISPGPGIPEQRPECIDIVKKFASYIPIFGVCLGHQIIAHAFGGKVTQAPEIVHGKQCKVFHRRQNIFAHLPLPMTVGRYHSLVVDRNLPDDLVLEADNSEGTVMAIRHRDYPCYGVQFHPESILTPQGEKMIQNFLDIAQMDLSQLRRKHA